MTPARFDRCQVERRFQRKSGRITAQGIVIDKVEMVTEFCHTPLFGRIEPLTGVCASCASGWTHRLNKPTARGKALIRHAAKMTEVLQEQPA